MKTFLSFFILSLMLAFPLCSVQAQGGARKDATREAETKGQDVVRAVTSQIENSNIFPNDNQFLRRIAWVESNDGTHPDTYRTGYHGGIWQVDEIGFNDTQNITAHRNLADRHKAITKHFKIKWADVSWEDLRKPLYSGLGARLLLSNKREAIPSVDDIRGQAEYWKRYYNTPAGAGTVDGFIKKVTALREQTASDCSVNIDLIFVIDVSGSIGSDNFELMRAFVSNFSNGLEIGPNMNQIGVITFNGEAMLQFSLNEHNEKTALLNAINNIPYTDGGTNIGAALDSLLRVGFTSAAGARLSSLDVLRIAMVLTDGQSNLISTQQAAMRVHAFKPAIIVYSVAIGDNVNEAEIEAIASRPDFIVQLQSFDPSQFQRFQDQSTDQICFEASTPINPGEQSSGSVAGGEEARVEIPIRDGITIQLCVKDGRVVFYASLTMPPSEAFYDWKIVSEKGCNTAFIDPDVASGQTRKKRQVDTERTLFVSMVGETAGDNTFTLDSAVSKPGQAVQIEPKTLEAVEQGESISFSCLGADVSSITVQRRQDGADYGQLPPFGSRLNITRMVTGRVDYVLGPLVPEDDTTFMFCTSGASISNEVQLSVYYPPRYTLPVASPTVIERQLSTIDLLLSSNPLPTPDEVTWYKNGEMITPSHRVTFDVDSLTFNPPYVGDVGVYEVIAGNYLGNDSLTFQLSVQYAPRYAERFGSFTCQKSGELIECVVPEGGSGHLECFAFGNPDPTLSLETRAQSSDNVVFDTEGGDVRITGATEDNKGFYTCTATNIVKQVQRTYSLLVGDGFLPPVEDLVVNVLRVEEEFILRVDWSYNISILSLPPTEFEIFLFDGDRQIAKWVQPKESRQISQPLAILNLVPSRMYQVALSGRNVLGASERTTSNFNFPDCPPMCSIEYCSIKRNRRALCTMSSAMRNSNCSLVCPVSFCHICYFDESLPRDSSLFTCSPCMEGYMAGALTEETRCFKKWAQCVRRADSGLYRSPSKQERTDENFKCYEHPCI